MNNVLSHVRCFDDVLLLPKFSYVKSRKDVSIRGGYLNLDLPIISSNMDTVTESKMAHAMKNAGGVGCLHRFCSIEDNVKMFLNSPAKTWVSVGLGKEELERAEALAYVGASTLVIDVAHGASQEVVNQYIEVVHNIPTVDVIVGNFATGESIDLFFNKVSYWKKPKAYKVGIGGGSACLTRVVTGCGVPTLESVIDCAATGETIIADGGIRNSGDFAKAMAAGASAVMMGRLLAGCEESPGDIYCHSGNEVARKVNDWFVDAAGRGVNTIYKKYRGSASLESYQVQGKVATHRTAEGDSYLIPYTGTVKETLQPFEAGLRSALAYVGANNLKEFKELAEFITISNNGVKENGAHGKQ